MSTEMLHDQHFNTTSYQQKSLRRHKKRHRHKFQRSEKNADDVTPTADGVKGEETLGAGYIDRDRLECFREQIEVNYADLNANIIASFQQFERTLRKQKEVLLQEARLLYEKKKSLLSSHVSTATKQSDVYEEYLRFAEGNMTFKVNEELLLKEFGFIEENLSSPQLSYIDSSTCKQLGTVNERASMALKTVANDHQLNQNDNDIVEVTVKNEKEEIVAAYQTRNAPMKSYHVTDLRSSESSLYSFAFVPTTVETFMIHAKLNHVHLKESPWKFKVFSKASLVFDSKNESTLNKASFKRNESVEEDWKEWYLHSDKKSSLFRPTFNTPSIIYASTNVDSLFSWKVKVKSSCSNITLSVGVATNSCIRDLNEYFAGHFTLEVNDKPSKGRTFLNRQTSAFCTKSFVYAMYLFADELRIHSENCNTSQTVKIARVTLPHCKLFPFCSIIHDREGCKRKICPRPQLTWC